MFDITQIESGLDNISLDQDINFIDSELDELIYAEEYLSDHISIKIPDFIEQINTLWRLSHTHTNMAVLNKITNDMVDAWNNGVESPTRLSDLKNDCNFITKEEAESIIFPYMDDNLILKSENGYKYLLKVRDNGDLYTVRVE